MRIKYLKVENHNVFDDLNLNFESAEGDISQYILLVGENGLGKSTLLRLLKNIIYMDFQEVKLLGASSIEICYSFQKSEQDFLAKKFAIELSLEDHLEIVACCVNQEWKFTLKINNETINQFTSDEFGTEKYQLRELFKFIYIDDLYGGNVNGSRGDNRFVLLDFHNQKQLIEKMKNKDKENIYHWYKSDRDLTYYTPVFEKLTTSINNFFDYKQIIEEDDDIVVKHDLQSIVYEDFSAGEKNIISLAASMIYYQEISEHAVILIEEPENSLHPRWQEKILNFIKEITETETSYNQIIATTHSPEIIRSCSKANTTTILFEIVGGKVNVTSRPELGHEEINLRTLSQKLIEDGQSNQTLVITEGITDWKHLKAAYKTLLEEGRIDTLNIDFLEYTENMGEAKLEKLLQYLKLIPSETTYIGIFDCDSKIGQKYIELKKFSDNVFAFSLPIPPDRSYHNGICTEFLYKDEDLKKTDSDGRRLYLSTEFDSRGGFYKEDDRIAYGNAKVIENYQEKKNEKILDSDVFNNSGDSLAMSKINFANYVLNEVPPFDCMDFSGFIPIFETIKQIKS